VHHPTSIVAEKCEVESANHRGKRAARGLLYSAASSRSLLLSPKRNIPMKYGLAWLLGIPIPILAVVYLVSHC